jgi:hypothetical protein
MPITDDTPSINALRRPVMRPFAWDPQGTARRTAINAAKLDALRFEARLVRRQLDRAPDDSRRALLARRLDAADARAADLNARLVKAASS